MKLTLEQKIQIYNDWKCGYESPGWIAKKYRLDHSVVEYMIRLADRYGVEKLEHNYNHYSADFKKEAIDRVLIYHESINEISLDLGIPNRGTLSRWLKEYRENGYNVVERKRGRHAKEGKDLERAAGRVRSTVKTELRPTQAELDSYNTGRISKKIRCLSFGKRRTRKQEIAQAVTELRQELKCSVDFILMAIKARPSLPQISRSDYYYWKDREDPDTKNDEIMNEIICRYYENKGRYGYRRITLDLRRDGWNVNHKTVKRLMTRMGLFGVTPKSKYKSYKGDMNGTVKSQLLIKKADEKGNTVYRRDFSTTSVNQKWTTDVTEFHIAAGKLYLSPIMDMYNHEIVSYNISVNPIYFQIQDMLDKAFSKYKDLKGLIFHSDQGWQYQMYQYHKVLQDNGIVQSMSRKGNCLDNCVMENFFGRLKNEMFYGHEYEFNTRDELKTAIEEYIDYYNNRRIQVNLKGLTPCEARAQALESR